MLITEKKLRKIIQRVLTLEDFDIETIRVTPMPSISFSAEDGVVPNFSFQNPMHIAAKKYIHGDLDDDPLGYSDKEKIEFVAGILAWGERNNDSKKAKAAIKKYILRNPESHSWKIIKTLGNTSEFMKIISLLWGAGRAPGIASKVASEWTDLTAEELKKAVIDNKAAILKKIRSAGSTSVDRQGRQKG